MRYHIAIIVFLFLALLVNNANGQEYSLKIDRTSFKIENTVFSGYITTFTQPHNEVKKTWWKYIKAKAVIFNKVSHYELRIPAKKGTSNTEVKMVSLFEIENKGKLTKLKVALRKDNLNKAQVDKLNQELKAMLLDFKITYFVSIVQSDIIEQEKKSIKISTKLNKLMVGKRRRNMSNNNFNSKEKELKQSLKVSNQALDALKKKLQEIK